MSHLKILCVVFLGAAALHVIDCKGEMYLNEVFPGEKLSSDWKVRPFSPQEKPPSFPENTPFYRVIGYPVACGRAHMDYASPREKDQPIDACVLSAKPEEVTLGSVLDQWIKNGLSAHYIIGFDDVVQWIDPQGFESRLVETWDKRSVGVLVFTNKYQHVEGFQGVCLDAILKHLNTERSQASHYPIRIQYLRDHDEARGFSRGVENLDTIFEMLNM